MSEITVSFRLDALGVNPKDKEEVRRYFWELTTQQHTPLINQLYLKVAKHPDFAHWRSNSALDIEALGIIWRAFEKEPQFETMPQQAFVSARLITSDTYKSWFALQSNYQTKIDKLLHSIEVLKTDVELTAICSCALEEIRNRAKEVLNQVNTQIANSNKKKKTKKAIEGGIYKLLYDKHRTTGDLQEKCAIAYLIKNRFEVRGDETEKDIENIHSRLHRKEKQVELLQKQLESRLPKGRLWVQQNSLDEIESIGVVEDETEWNQIESALLKQQTVLPHPILFRSSDALIWFEHERPHSKNFKAKDGEKSYSGSSKRYCIRFKSFDEKYSFELAGDHRHLHILRQAVKERMIYDNDEDRNTSKLFLVRSAQLIWKEYKKNENRIVRRRKAANKQARRNGQSVGNNLEVHSPPEYYDPKFPWNRYQLFLHCTIETRYLSKEGTEIAIEWQRKPIVKALKTLEERIVESERKGESAQTRKARYSRQAGTLRRIDSYENNYGRPSVDLYKGGSHIITGVALGSGGSVTATVVDATSGKILECRGRKALLGENNRLVKRRQFQRQINEHSRTENQKRSANSQFGTSKSGEAIDRHLANSVIELAKKHSSGTIVVPDMKDYRERKQSEIAALAERECSGWKEVEKKFAKAQNKKNSSLSYGRLIRYIRNYAQKEDISVLTGRQPIYGNSQVQAKEMAIATYQEGN